MSGSFTNIGLFLINTVFDLYITLLIVRLILAFSRADYFNPITRFIITVTQPIIAPLRRIIPNRFGIEFSTLIFILALEILKFFLISLLFFSALNIAGLMLFATIDTLKHILNIFFYAILLQAILSWIQTGYSPLSQVLAQLTTPILRPLRRFVPPVGGFDLTPIPALIILQCLLLLL